MISRFNRKIVLPSYFGWQKDRRLQRLAELEESQWHSREEILAIQFDKFKALLKYAYEKVPFYKKRYKVLGMEPADIKTPDDITKLPTLNKTDIQNHLEELVSVSFPRDKMLEDSSGGSTGKPVVFVTDKSNRYLRRAAVWRSDKWTGWNVGEKSAYLWGADRDVSIIRGFKERMVQKFIFRSRILNSFQLTGEGMRRYAILLQKEKPTLIVAYANSANLFANFLNQNPSIRFHSPKGTVCSAETLSEEKRKTIESAFGCKVLNRYGSREVGLIACECDRQEGLHINAEDILVEIDVGIQSDGTKGFGEIIVSDLNNRAMPFIRYRTGDVGVATDESCSCKRGLPLIREVKGRTSDFIVHMDGYLIHGESFSHAFYGIREIQQFQVRQRAIDLLDVKIVVAENFKEEHKYLIDKKVREIIGNKVQTNIAVVEDIPVTDSGKFRFAISDIVEQHLTA